MPKRLWPLLVALLLSSFAAAPMAGAGGTPKAPAGVWSGGADQEGDLGILVISNWGAGKQPAMYLEKLADACGPGPMVLFDPLFGLDGATWTLHADLFCADTGEVPYPGVQIMMEYDADADTWTLMDETYGPMERRCEAPAEAPAGGGPIEGTDGDDILLGTDGDDEIDGKGGIDILCGFGGKDHLNGGADHDILLGGPQKDDMRGKSGVDYLDGGPHKDKLFGNSGNDFLIGDNHDDKLRGGSGYDYAHGGKDKEGDTCEAEDETKCELDF